MHDALKPDQQLIYFFLSLYLQILQASVDNSSHLYRLSLNYIRLNVKFDSDFLQFPNIAICQHKMVVMEGMLSLFINPGKYRF